MLNYMRRLLIAFWCCVALVNGAVAQPFYITNVTAGASGVALDWMSPTDLYIVAQSGPLGGGLFGYVGSVLSTNHADLANDLPAAFFRVRRVAVVDIPARTSQPATHTQSPLILFAALLDSSLRDLRFSSWCIHSASIRVHLRFALFSVQC